MPPIDGTDADADARAVEALRALVRIPTVSRRDPDDVDHEAFDRFHAELRERFPLLHQHLDVVPVEDGDPWQHDAFGADIVDGSIWGRGTLDDKGALVAICAAVERLLAEGVTPAQDVWLSFGSDEEVSGTTARQAVDVLRGKGVRPWFVIDEGGAVAHQALPGIGVPVAVVGVTEKGVTSLELVSTGRGGHASIPVRGGPTARIARAVTRLDRLAMPVHVAPPVLDLLRRLAPHAPRPLRPLLRNAERLGPLLPRLFVAAGAEPAAMVRTTVAVTTLSGSPALNVVAATARAGVNVRVMVGDTVDGVLARIRGAIGDDRVSVEVLERNEPSPLSPVDDDAFRLLERTIRAVFPDTVPVPYVMMAATDSRHFTALSPRVYRFAPFRMSKAQRAAIHSYDEHLGVQDFLDGVAWYTSLLQNLPADGSDA